MWEVFREVWTEDKLGKNWSLKSTGSGVLVASALAAASSPHLQFYKGVESVAQGWVVSTGETCQVRLMSGGKSMLGEFCPHLPSSWMKTTRRIEGRVCHALLCRRTEVGPCLNLWFQIGGDSLLRLISVLSLQNGWHVGQTPLEYWSNKKDQKPAV